MARFTGGGSGGGAGTAGAGYDWKVPATNDSTDFSTTEMYLYSDSGFGAYAVGNYVRYYVNPDENPLGWVEGRISYMSSTDMNLSVKSWSPEALGMEGQSGGQWTTAPYMTVIGEPGEGYSYTFVDGATPGAPLNFSDATYGYAHYVGGLLGEAFNTRDYVRVTFSNGEWVEGTLEIMSREGINSYFYVHIQRTYGVSYNDPATSEIASVSLASYTANENDAITGNFNRAITDAEMYPGYNYIIAGNPAAYSVGDFIRFSVDANNWIEGLVYAINPAVPSGNQNQTGNLTLTANKWSLPDGITDNSSNIFVQYPNAKLEKLALPADGYSGGRVLSIYPQPSPPALTPAFLTPGYQWTYVGKIGAYRVGDRVRFDAIESEPWMNQEPPFNSEVLDISFEAVITSVTTDMYGESITVSIESWDVPQSVIDYENSWSHFSIGLVGQSGLGYVYEWSYPLYPDAPDLNEPYVGLQYPVPGKFNAFAVGDYVTFNFDPSAPSDWPTISGTITSLVNRGTQYEEAMITIAEWSPSAASGASPSADNSYPSTLHLAGKPGAAGAAGAGYNYVYPEGFGGPGMPMQFINTTITIDGPFGAYAVGNLVRYYCNPYADPTAWVEGEITGKTGDEYLNILINNWSPTAIGMSGSNFNDPVRPYMTLIGAPGTTPSGFTGNIATNDGLIIVENGIITSFSAM